MEIRIQAIHFDASEKLEKFIQKKVSKLEQYSRRSFFESGKTGNGTEQRGWN